MAFDSGMLRCICTELNHRFQGGKIEKILQPEKDEIDLVIRANGKSDRLLISCSSNNARLCVTQHVKENPESAYMFCMLLRKHLIGARVEQISQMGFERVARIVLEAGDELGFRKKRSLYLEIMGRNSTLVFCDENDCILYSSRYVDLSSSISRKLMVGLPYQLPESQNKVDATLLSRQEIFSFCQSAPQDYPVSRFLVDTFQGISPLVGREVAFLASGDCEALLARCDRQRLADCFFSVMERIRKEDFSCTVLYKTEEDGAPFEFSFLPIAQYQSTAVVKSFASPSQAIDLYFHQRDCTERKKQHYNDIYTILKNARNRLQKKIQIQTQELTECDLALELRKKGDLIMQELYRIRKQDLSVVATDYTVDPPQPVEIQLDPRLSPSANAQKYYKDYNKKTVARERITQQLSAAGQELTYVLSVLEALERSQGEADFSQIRQELAMAGYGKRGVAMKSVDKRKRSVPDQYRSPNGFKVYAGRNNIQNDHITFDLACKEDVWFHVKDYPGSHVLLVSEGQKVPDADLEFAARLAAGLSGGAGADKVSVDYTLARYVKKPSGARPGFVNYFKYTTVYVSPLKNCLPLEKSGKM